MFISHSGGMSIMDQHRMLFIWSQRDSDETAATILFMIMCPRGKGDLKGLPGLMNCSGLEVTNVPFCSQFLARTCPVAPPNHQGSKRYNPTRRGESQKYLLSGIYHSLSTYHVPGFVLSIFLVDPLISSTTHGSRDFYLQLILE